MAVGVAGRNMAGLDQQGIEGLAAPHAAADRQGAQGVAVIALAPGDEAVARRLADFQEVLAGQLERRLVGLGAAGDVVDPGQVARRPGDQVLGQGFRGLGGEEGAVDVGDAVDLLLDGPDHRRVAVPQTGHRGTAGGVQVAFAGAVDDIGALALNRARIVVLRLAVEHVAHGMAQPPIPLLAARLVTTHSPNTGKPGSLPGADCARRACPIR